MKKKLVVALGIAMIMTTLGCGNNTANDTSETGDATVTTNSQSTDGNTTEETEVAGTTVAVDDSTIKERELLDLPGIFPEQYYYSNILLNKLQDPYDEDSWAEKNMEFDILDIDGDHHLEMIATDKDCGYKANGDNYVVYRFDGTNEPDRYYSSLSEDDLSQAAGYRFTTLTVDNVFHKIIEDTGNVEPDESILENNPIIIDYLYNSIYSGTWTEDAVKFAQSAYSIGEFHGEGQGMVYLKQLFPSIEVTAVQGDVLCVKIPKNEADHYMQTVGMGADSYRNLLNASGDIYDTNEDDDNIYIGFYKYGGYVDEPETYDYHVLRVDKSGDHIQYEGMIETQSGDGGPYYNEFVLKIYPYENSPIGGYKPSATYTYFSEFNYEEGEPYTTITSDSIIDLDGINHTASDKEKIFNIDFQSETPITFDLETKTQEGTVDIFITEKLHPDNVVWEKTGMGTENVTFTLTDMQKYQIHVKGNQWKGKYEIKYLDNLGSSTDDIEEF